MSGLARGLPVGTVLFTLQASNMRRPFRLSVVLLAAAAAVVGCSKGSKQKEVATTVAQDTMLLHDLAEANKNTAAASANDNSLTTVRNSGEPTAGTVEEVSQNRPANTTVVPRPVPADNQIRTTTPRMTVPTTANDAPGRTTVPLDRSPAAAPSSGDPCDSPTTTDQRSCLNRSIATNDADLNSTYQELIAQSRKSGGPDLEERIRQAQRAWVNERDIGCRGESQSSGKLWARAVARCLANYSDRRVVELQRQLSSLRGQ
jgi:uncharacterized protein YecT (DUF1311 family)